MNRIKELRKNSKLSQIELAKIANVSNQAISAYESGTREPKKETWQKLADIYGVSVPYLQGIDKEIYDLKFPTQQEAIDFIHKIMRAQGIKLEDIQNESEVVSNDRFTKS